MIILAIESSCDETAAAVVKGRQVLSNVVATQIEEHKIYGGVVPEIASRRHTEAIAQVVEKAGGYEAVCTLLDGEDTLLEYRLFVPTQIQAQMIVDQFENDPTGKYKSILSLLIDEKLFEE